MSSEAKPGDLRQNEDHERDHEREDHPKVEIERIETVSSSTAPWSVRLIFGVLGVVFLAAALAAWQFRALFEGHVAQALPYIIIGLAVLGVGAIVESITTEIWLALIAGVAALAVTFLIVGRTQVYPTADGRLYMVDRFSGGVQLCAPEGCKPLLEVKDFPKPPLPIPPVATQADSPVVSGPISSAAAPEPAHGLEPAAAQPALPAVTPAAPPPQRTPAAKPVKS